MNKNKITQFSILSMMFILLVASVQGAKLPTVGSEDERDKYGNILNDYLSVAHTENGTLRNNSVQDFMLNLSVITLADFTNDAGFLKSVVNFSGNYNDLTNKPTLLSQFSNDVGFLKNVVNFSGVYNDLTGKPSLFSGNFNDLTNKPTLLSAFINDIGFINSVVNFSGNYNDLANKPSLFSGNYNDLSNKPTLLSQFTNDAGFFKSGDTIIAGRLKTSDIDTSSASGTLFVQTNADSSGRVRLFRNTTGNPLFNIWGYDSGNSVQKPLTLGVFNDPAFNEAGGGATARAIITSGGNGANDRNTLELQSPSQVRITAVDSILKLGDVRIAADKYIRFHPRTDAETDSAKYFTIDTVGQAQGANIELSTNAGDLVLNPAGNVNLKGGFTGDCSAGVHVLNGIVTGCI